MLVHLFPKNTKSRGRKEEGISNRLLVSNWIGFLWRFYYYCMLSCILLLSRTSIKTTCCALNFGVSLRRFSVKSSRLISDLSTSFHNIKTASPPATKQIQTIMSTIPSVGPTTTTNNTSLSATNNNYTTQKKKVAKLISTSAQSIAQAGSRLRSGRLVSFPTETVYGLGCYALDESAIHRVFAAKERPLTDPLIVHVVEVQDALKLWHASSSDENDDNEQSVVEREVLKALTAKLWPGPLTIVSRASVKVPAVLMANTGYVACRSPIHPVARSLIKESGIPIAAPSANKFGHVSPTRARHVMEDLGGEDVWIVDPDLQEEEEGEGIKTSQPQGNDEERVICNVGVESTVAKISMDTSTSGKIIILRHGAVSSKDILSCLQDCNLTPHFQVIAKSQATDETVNHVAPGQTVRHYSPNVQSYMISPKRHLPNVEWSQDEKECLKTAVVIDFGGKLKSCQKHALAYRDLSETGDSQSAAANVFDTLRWSETVVGAKRVYFPEIPILTAGNNEEDALVLAVKDRLTRAASGVVIDCLI